MHNNNWQGRKAKDLALIVNNCFGEIVGNTTNETQPSNSVNDIIFVMNSLNAMVENYLQFKSNFRKPEEKQPANEFIPPIVVKNMEDFEKVFIAIDKVAEKICRSKPN